MGGKAKRIERGTGDKRDRGGNGRKGRKIEKDLPLDRGRNIISSHLSLGHSSVSANQLRQISLL